MKRTLILLSFFFVFLSFYPTLNEIQQAKNLPKDRVFELVHNYVFDYNFYLSRIREGQEGKWLVSEKYFSQPHKGSLFQILYLLLGKLGGLGGVGPPAVYHISRLLMGLMLLMLIGKLVQSLFTGWWQLVGYFFVVTAGSWPILTKLADNTYRLSSHWGGWSVIDPLQRITFMPHVLLGQIFLVLFVWKFGLDKTNRTNKTNMILWGAIGLVAGIIFPPVLVTIYVILGVQTILEIIQSKSLKLPKSLRERSIFVFFSLPALLYLQVMFKIEPWQALAVFDVQHRSVLPYAEYALALGPMLPLGILGGLVVLGKWGGLGKMGEKEEKLIPFVSWVLALGLLFAIFERVPQQSPTRFTQMLINVPLGIMGTYLLYSVWTFYDKYKRSHLSVIKVGIGLLTGAIILTGLGIMMSMVGWKTDEVRGKVEGTWLYPVGVQLVYPLKDFMDGIEFLRLNTKTTDVVLAFEAAGNYIPAYAGNYVYLGHANTPDEDGKLKIAARFFKGEMSLDEAKTFLTRENIRYIYFGPQERELGGIKDLVNDYTFLNLIYSNNQVVIYQFR